MSSFRFRSVISRGLKQGQGKKSLPKQISEFENWKQTIQDELQEVSERGIRDPGSSLLDSHLDSLDDWESWDNLRAKWSAAELKDFLEDMQKTPEESSRKVNLEELSKLISRE